MVAVATVTATPIAAAGVSAVVHLDMSSIIVALITGIFGTIQIYMISRLHTMVNSQQSTLNQIAREDAMKAGIESGKAAGVLAERERSEIQKKHERDLVEETAKRTAEHTVAIVTMPPTKEEK